MGRATSHAKLKARDHCILRSLIGRKGQDRPSSLHTRRWRPKASKKLSWTISLHGLPKFGGGPNANSGRPCQLNIWYNLWMRAKDPHNYMNPPLARVWSGPKKEHTSHSTWAVIATRPHLHTSSPIYNCHRLDSMHVNGVMFYWPPMSYRKCGLGPTILVVYVQIVATLRNSPIIVGAQYFSRAHTNFDD